jgi:hypothetical protein
MKTSFDIVLLLFTTCLVTGFKQFSSFFENNFSIQENLRKARSNEAWQEQQQIVQWVTSVFHMLMAQYILILVWLCWSLYLELNVSARAMKDTRTKPIRILQVYSFLSIGLLLYVAISSLCFRTYWTGKLVRPIQSGQRMDLPPDFRDFVLTMESLFDINYVFTLGIEVFIVFIIIQLWEEKTINEYRIRLEGENTIDIASLDGKSLQKYHFGSAGKSADEKCLFSSKSKMSLSDQLACMLA